MGEPPRSKLDGAVDRVLTAVVAELRHVANAPAVHAQPIHLETLWGSSSIRGGRFKRLNNIYIYIYIYVFGVGPDPGNPQNWPEIGARTPQISSDCPRKSLDFKIGVGDRLGTLRVSRSKRLFSI